MGGQRVVLGWHKAMALVREGASWRVAIERHIAPKDWPEALKLVPDAASRAVAETYLRGMAARLKAAKAAKETTWLVG